MREETVKNLCLRIIKGGLFIVPFIPLYISKVLFFPYITGKAFVFRIIVEIVFTAWICLAIFYKEYRLKHSYLSWAVGAFILAAALATIFSVNPSFSFWSNYERMEGLVTYLHLGAYFLVLASVFKKSDWKIFLNLFVLAAIYENSYAFLQKIGVFLSPQGGTSRTDGTIGNPTYLAAYLIFILFFCILLWLEETSRPKKYFYGGMAAWTALTIYFTASRGPTLALIFGAIVFSIIYLIFKRPENAGKSLNKKMTLIILAVFLIIPPALWFLRDKPVISGSPVLNRLTSISLSERTIASRFTIWKMGFDGFKEHPILGWGPGNYGLVFSKYFRPELWKQEPWFDRSHNIIFDWLINAGLIGAISYFSIFLAAGYLIRLNYLKNYFSMEKAALLAVLLLVYLMQNFFVFDQIATYISFFAVLAYIHSSSVLSDGSVGKLKENLYLIAGVLLIPLVLIIYFINGKPLLANLSLLNALSLQGQNLETAFNSYEKALAYNTLGNQEIREQLARFAIATGSLTQNPDFADKVLRRAIGEAQKGVLENPLDARAYLFLGTIYSRVGLADEALKVFNKAIELSPRKQHIYFELADVYIKKSDYPKAVEVLERAYNLDPEFNGAGMNLAAVYILNNQQEKADALLIKFQGTVNAADNVLAQIYSIKKDYRRLIGVWEAFVKLDPNNDGYWKNLSNAYLLLPDRQSAIESLERAIKAIPSFKSEGENLIQEIKRQK